MTNYKIRRNTFFNVYMQHYVYMQDFASIIKQSNNNVY